MRERPILFSGPMVRAILEGRKSQTRRVVKPQPVPSTEYGRIHPADGSVEWCARDGRVNEITRGPYGVPGDRLAVRETWRFWGWTEDGIPWVEYRADGKKRLLERATIPFEWGDRLADIWADLSTAGNCPADDNGEGFRACDKGWRSPIRMPRWASRITLELTDVRVERVMEISSEDAKAEGLSVEDPRTSAVTGIGRFARLWDQINAKRGYGWDANPWVWVIEFRRIAA